MTYAVIPHRLIPGVAVSGATLPEGLNWTNTNAGGFGSAAWTQRTAPDLEADDDVTVTCEGGTVFEGTVKSVSGGVGEQLVYRVDAVGNMDKLKRDETVEGVFVDRDVSQWHSAECDNWGDASGFEIAATADGAKLRLDFPEADGLLVDTSEPLVSYDDYEGNSPPPFDVSDFPTPKSLWSAVYYHLSDGVTSKSISRISFDADWCLTRALFLAKTTRDYNNPIGPADERYGHRFAKYPKMSYWTEFYGLPTDADGVATIENLFVGLYCCDDPADLPVGDARAMKSDPHLLMRFHQDAAEKTSHHERFSFDCAGQMLVLYASYLPVQLPFNKKARYRKNADHIIRKNWVAANRLYVEPGSFIALSNVAVCAQGYAPGEDGSDDLAAAIRILYPNCSCPSLKLPSTNGDFAPPGAVSMEPQTAPVSIAIREPTTMLAAITDLLDLYPEPLSWGIWEDDELIITRPADEEAYSISDEPGVDTTGAALSSEGAVDAVLVAYTPSMSSVRREGYGLTFSVSTPALVLVDKDGNATDVDPGWEPDEGARIAFRDATGEAQGRAAAVSIGAKAAVERRPGQATGSIVLHAIAGASVVRPGVRVEAPGIDDDDALITSTTCDVTSDTVSLSLGPTGYVGRFPAQVPGKPLTVLPKNVAKPVSRPIMRRVSGR